MPFIGVGMVSTVTPHYLTLASFYKPLGILILGLAVRLCYGAPPLSAGMPEAMKLAVKRHPRRRALMHELIRKDGVFGAMAGRR